MTRKEHLRRAKISATKMKHGHAGSADGSRKRSPEYGIWAAMIQRCHNVTHKDFKYYGGSGIVVTARWKEFENFLKDMGERPAGLTLDRIDPHGPYAPWNCRWTTRSEQARNRKSTIWIKLNGTDMTLLEACRSLGVPYDRTRMRLKAGKSIEEALKRENAWQTFSANGRPKI